MSHLEHYLPSAIEEEAIHLITQHIKKFNTLLKG